MDVQNYSIADVRISSNKTNKPQDFRFTVETGLAVHTPKHNKDTFWDIMSYIEALFVCCLVLHLPRSQFYE